MVGGWSDWDALQPTPVNGLPPTKASWFSCRSVKKKVKVNRSKKGKSLPTNNVYTVLPGHSHSHSHDHGHSHSQTNADPHATWWHGDITRPEAEQRLQGQREGVFLMRRSGTHPTDMAMTQKNSTGFTHYLICQHTPTPVAGFNPAPPVWQLHGLSHVFKTLEELMNYYSRVAPSQRNGGVVLTSACPIASLGGTIASLQHEARSG